jgi:hypothetical protein
MVNFLCLIHGCFKSKNWNILFFYSLKGFCERKYTLPLWLNLIHIFYLIHQSL